MNEIVPLIPALITGMLLGAIFFGGLWWTIRKGLTSPHPVLWFVSSLLIRSLITVTGFYLISAGSWQKILACLTGFLMTRFLISHFFHFPATNAIPIDKESNHAPESR